MYITSENYKLEIKKPSRSFECKITIGNNIYTNDDIVDIILETIQPGEGFSIGNTPSQTLDLTLLNRGEIVYSTSQVKVEIGLNIGPTIEYILVGLFNIDDIEKTDYTTKIIAYDNMIRFEIPYFSNLTYPANLQQVVNELATKTGVQFTGSLPAYTVKKLEGFTCREILGYVSSICGGNALITREGKFTIITPKNIDYSITPDNYIDYKREEVKYKIGKITCQNEEKETISTGNLGIDSMELLFENPWVTPTILADIYNKLKGFEYLGYNMKWQGDISLDIGDTITCTDVKGVIRNIPILSQKFIYNGGLTAEIGAKGESKNKNSFNSSGSNSNKVDRMVTELLLVNEALIDKANIQDLTAVNIKTQKLETKTAEIENAIIGKADIEDLDVITAEIENLVATDVTINKALIDKANITDLDASIGRITDLESKFGKIDILESDLAKIDTLVNGQLTSDNIQSLILTSDKVTVDNGFIKNAMIENLDVSKINAGDISTNKFKIKSDNGGIEIVGATQQFKDKNSNVRIQMGQDTQGNFNFILKGEDGTTTLIDHTGIKENAIGDDLIKGNMISESAVGGKQIDYNSFTEEFNKDTNTNTLKSSKVLLDGTNQTLNLAFNTLNSTVNGVKSTTESNTTAIKVQQGEIETLISNTTITKEDGEVVQLKDEYSTTKNTVNEISGKIGTVEQNITDISEKVETTESSIKQLNNSISLKVSKSEVETTVNNAIDEIEVGGRNLLIKSRLDYIPSSSSGTGTISEIIEDDVHGKVLHTNKQYVYGSELYLPKGMLKVGDNVTLSILVKAKVNSIFTCQLYNTATISNSFTFNAKTEWQWLSFTQTVVGDPNVDSILYLYFKPTDEYWIKNIKVELGNKATDWTPAPEDVDEQFNDVYNHISNETQEITKNYETAIDQKADSITLSVSESYSTKDDISSLETSLKSLIEQTAGDITLSFEGATDYTKEIDGKLQEFIDIVKTYIQFSADGITLGKLNNPFVATLGNTELAFLQDGVKVAYISNNKLYITDADIRNKLTIGNPTNGYFDYIPRQNGNLSMKWRSS